MQIKCELAALAMVVPSCALLDNAHAQPATAAWNPTGNVEFFVGAGAGGENDRIARAIQRVLTKEHLVDYDDGAQQAGRRANHRHDRPRRARKATPTRSAWPRAASSTPSPAKAWSCNKQLTPLIKLFDAYQCYFTDDQLADQDHGRRARPAQSRSRLGDVRVPGRSRQPAACLRGQCRQDGRRAGEKAGDGGVRFRLRRLGAGRRRPHRCRRNQHRQLQCR